MHFYLQFLLLLVFNSIFNMQQKKHPQMKRLTKLKCTYVNFINFRKNILLQLPFAMYCLQLTFLISFLL